MALSSPPLRSITSTRPSLGRPGQDEPVDQRGAFGGDADATGIGTAVARLRAERDEKGDGRVYHVQFSAQDADGGQCQGEVLVSVPRHRDRPALDDGPSYDSTQPGGAPPTPPTWRDLLRRILAWLKGWLWT